MVCDPLRNEFRRQIADLEKAGIISKSNSQYNTPTLFVKQKEKWRLVLDFRKLNEITLTQDFVIPTLDDILREISGSKYFSALDMKSAFNQIPLHFADRHKTAFSTPDGDKYEINRLWFGLKKTRLKHFSPLHKRRYIKNFAKRALPLTNLLRKDTPFEWTSETQEAFDDIKEAILNPLVLALPDPNAELQITTDASSRVADHLSRCINYITIALPESKDLIKMQHEDPVLSLIIQKIDQNDVSPVLLKLWGRAALGA
ncbi:retrovirus-related Pol polyprotein from transposon opus [Trichonephila clavipes]|nr:retrovirus-related Pol polyprotein from transposon opus [Trichonephila clavipes]